MELEVPIKNGICRTTQDADAIIEILDSEGLKIMVSKISSVGLWAHHAPRLQSAPTFCSHFQKKCFIRSRVCRTAPNQSALESTDPGASSDGSNFEIQPLGIDLVSFEVARLPQNWK